MAPKRKSRSKPADQSASDSDSSGPKRKSKEPAPKANSKSKSKVKDPLPTSKAVTRSSKQTNDLLNVRGHNSAQSDQSELSEASTSTSTPRSSSARRYEEPKTKRKTTKSRESKSTKQKPHSKGTTARNSERLVEQIEQPEPEAEFNNVVPSPRRSQSVGPVMQNREPNDLVYDDHELPPDDLFEIGFELDELPIPEGLLDRRVAQNPPVGQNPFGDYDHRRRGINENAAIAPDVNAAAANVALQMLGQQANPRQIEQPNQHVNQPNWPEAPPFVLNLYNNYMPGRGGDYANQNQPMAQAAAAPPLVQNQQNPGFPEQPYQPEHHQDWNHHQFQNIPGVQYPFDNRRRGDLDHDYRNLINRAWDAAIAFAQQQLPQNQQNQELIEQPYQPVQHQAWNVAQNQPVVHHPIDNYGQGRDNYAQQNQAFQRNDAAEPMVGNVLMNAIIETILQHVRQLLWAEAQNELGAQYPLDNYGAGRGGYYENRAPVGNAAAAAAAPNYNIPNNQQQPFQRVRQRVRPFVQMADVSSSSAGQPANRPQARMNANGQANVQAHQADMPLPFQYEDF